MSLIRLFRSEIAKLMLAGFLVGSAAVGMANIGNAFAADAVPSTVAR